MDEYKLFWRSEATDWNQHNKPTKGLRAEYKGTGNVHYGLSRGFFLSSRDNLKNDGWKCW